MRTFTLARLDDLHYKLKDLGETKKVILFAASLNNDKVSWCPDCRKADPVINQCIQELEPTLEPDFTFITVYCGQKDEWKSPNNEFRKSPEFKVDCVPTLYNPAKVKLI